MEGRKRHTQTGKKICYGNFIIKLALSFITLLFSLAYLKGLPQRADLSGLLQRPHPQYCKRIRQIFFFFLVTLGNKTSNILSILILELCFFWIFLSWIFGFNWHNKNGPRTQWEGSWEENLLEFYPLPSQNLQKDNNTYIDHERG